MTSTVRAPVKDTLAFAWYHLNVAIDHVFLFLDDPGDPATPELSKSDRITCIPCDGAHWRSTGSPRPGVIEDRQRANANVALDRVREWGFDWIIHVDSDELIHPGRNLREVLDEVPVRFGAVRFQLMEAVPKTLECDLAFTDMSLFRVQVDPTREEAAREAGCSEAFVHGRYLRGHKSSKVAVRTELDVLDLGIHKPSLRSGKVLVLDSPEISLLHFDSRGFTPWKRKWESRLDGSAPARELSPVRTRQMSAFIQLRDREEELLEYYRELYMMPRDGIHRQVLCELGMLRRIKLAESLFREPL